VIREKRGPSAGRGCGEGGLREKEGRTPLKRGACIPQMEQISGLLEKGRGGASEKFLHPKKESVSIKKDSRGRNFRQSRKVSTEGPAVNNRGGPGLLGSGGDLPLKKAPS